MVPTVTLIIPTAGFTAHDFGVEGNSVERGHGLLYRCSSARESIPPATQQKPGRLARAQDAEPGHSTGRQPRSARSSLGELESRYA